MLRSVYTDTRKPAMPLLGPCLRQDKIRVDYMLPKSEDLCQIKLKTNRSRAKNWNLRKESAARHSRIDSRRSRYKCQRRSATSLRRRCASTHSSASLSESAWRHCSPGPSVCDTSPLATAAAAAAILHQLSTTSRLSVPRVKKSCYKYFHIHTR